LAGCCQDDPERAFGLDRACSLGQESQSHVEATMTNRICHIDIDEKGLARPTPEIEQERRVAVYDLLEENSFCLPDRDGRVVPAGPYRLHLAIREGRLVFGIATEDETAVGEFHLSLGPFRQVVKDYFQICESYFEAVKRLPPSQIEAIDMARRGIHNEGARVLQERLEGKARVDTDTARRLFTLIGVLHWG
jgi:uncharacterized protein (UPF0262 family)